MMQTYLGDDADDLDGVEIVAQLNEKAGDEQVNELVAAVVPIQQNEPA